MLEYVQDDLKKDVNAVRIAIENDEKLIKYISHSIMMSLFYSLLFIY